MSERDFPGLVIGFLRERGLAVWESRSSLEFPGKLALHQRTRVFQFRSSSSRMIPLRIACWARLLLVAGMFLAGTTATRAGTAENHWAFQPVRAIQPPAVRQHKWVRNGVDSLVLATLEANRLKPSRPATREQLIRRVTFDLIGLPPTPDEIDAFVKDRSPDAYAKLIDRLLASPQYGERWARHWLDLVRYAESDGFEHDAVRPHAWRYRDYVIRSLNADKPYDRFVQEQIAGDELWPDEPDALIATSFNLLGPDMVDSADQTQRRLLTLSDMTDTTSVALLGLTMGCARCHNHKNEPFTQRDYYSLQAFFAPTVFERNLPVPSAAERVAHDAAMAKYRAASEPTQKQVDEIEEPYRERIRDEKLAKLSEDAQLAHRTPKEKRTMEQEGTVQETASMVAVADAEVLKAMSSADKKRRTVLLNDLKKLPKPSPLPMAMALRNGGDKNSKTFVLVRGDYNNPTDEVAAAFPVALKRSNAGVTATKSRADLARWIGSAGNPLTARVMVNRIWQHHFGHGLVSTVGNFGTQGAAPSHPELLDWLAQKFVTEGWSLKAMHRLILLSATYQQSSEPSREALARDPSNQLLSHQNQVRLEGEAIRDSLLAVSGRLNPKMGGPSVLPPIPTDITKTSKNWTASADPDEHRRRSIYIFARRNLRFPFLEAFDAPDSNLSCPERGQSTTAPQSLTLLNSDEVMDAARATAKLIIDEATGDTRRIDRAYRTILGRPPTKKELAMSRNFLAASMKDNEAAEAGWTELCRALFNLNAFVYVD